MQLGFFTMPIHPLGKDRLDRELGRRSMILPAEKVLPAVNAAISKG